MTLSNFAEFSSDLKELKQKASELVRCQIGQSDDVKLIQLKFKSAKEICAIINDLNSKLSRLGVEASAQIGHSLLSMQTAFAVLIQDGRLTPELCLQFDKTIMQLNDDILALVDNSIISKELFHGSRTNFDDCVKDKTTNRVHATTIPELALFRAFVTNNGQNIDYSKKSRDSFLINGIFIDNPTEESIGLEGWVYSVLPIGFKFEYPCVCVSKKPAKILSKQQVYLDKFPTNIPVYFGTRNIHGPPMSLQRAHDEIQKRFAVVHK